MIVGFTTTCAISACHHWRCELEFRARRGVLDTTLCDKFCQWLVTGRRFSLVFLHHNKTDLHDIAEILLKVALNTITQPDPIQLYFFYGGQVTSIHVHVTLYSTDMYLKCCYFYNDIRSFLSADFEHFIVFSSSVLSFEHKHMGG